MDAIGRNTGNMDYGPGHRQNKKGDSVQQFPVKSGL